MTDLITIPIENVIWHSSLESANFAMFYPRSLPEDLSVDSVTYRPTNPSRLYPRCSLKITLCAKERTLSISLMCS